MSEGGDVGADPPRPGFGRALAAAVAVALGLGTLAGYLDLGLTALTGESVAADAFFAVVAFHAASFTLLAIVLAAGALRLREGERVIVPLGTALLGVWIAVGVLLLHVFPEDRLLSLPVLGSIVPLTAVAVLAARWRWQRSGGGRVRAVRWALAGVVGVALTAALLVEQRPDEGPEPVALAAPGAPQPNVLVYMIDTLRADHMSGYGYERPTSPEIDAFAADATLYEACWAPCSWTVPSVVSAFLGLYPSTHDTNQIGDVLPPEVETLAEVLRAAGWRTGGFCDNPHLTRESGMVQGFDEWSPLPIRWLPLGTIANRFAKNVPHAGLRARLQAEQSIRGCRDLQEQALRFIDDGGSGPWFAYVHTMEPHTPYVPPRELATQFGYPEDEPYTSRPGGPPKRMGCWPWSEGDGKEPTDEDVRKYRALYDAEVLDVSRGFGELLDALRERGLLEDTIVVLVSDHGEEFFEHGDWTHGVNLFKESTFVPLIVRLPDALGPAAAATRGRRVQEPASLVDLLPTLLDTLQVGYPALDDWVVRGRALTDVTGAEPDPEAPGRPLLMQLVGHAWGAHDVVNGLREGRWLYLRGTSEDGRELRALYDTVADPAELDDRSQEESGRAAAMEKTLDQLVRVLEATGYQAGGREIDAEAQRQLKALGYLGGK